MTVYERWTKLGICPRCKENPRCVESVYCTDCLEKQRQRQIETAKVKAAEAVTAAATMTASRLSQQVCIDCGLPDIFQHNRCRVCEASRLERGGMPRYNARLIVGLCQSCPTVVESGTVRCEVCKKKRKQITAECNKAGLCTQCHKPVDRKGRQCSTCLKKQRDKRKQWKADGVCPQCGEPSEEGRLPGSLCYKDRIISRRKNRRKGIKLKAQIIAAYGGECQCPGCHENRPEFLELDHINNDGNVERRRLSGRQTGQTTKHYAKLRREGFPKDNIQLLCVNCNKAKHTFGRCPHHSSLVAPKYPADPTPEAVEDYTQALIEYLTCAYEEKKKLKNTVV